MADILTVEELLGTKPAHERQDTVVIEGLGTIRVRALSLIEHREMRRECGRGDDWDERRWNALLLMHGVEKPQLTYDQAVQVTEMSVGPIDDLILAILRISGLLPGGAVDEGAVEAAEATFPE